MSEPTQNVLPWWLEPGSANCEFCAVIYREETAYYCVECDRSVCPVCVSEVRETRAVICPECAK